MGITRKGSREDVYLEGEKNGEDRASRMAEKGVLTPTSLSAEILLTSLFPPALEISSRIELVTQEKRTEGRKEWLPLKEDKIRTGPKWTKDKWSSKAGTLLKRAWLE